MSFETWFRVVAIWLLFQAVAPLFPEQPAAAEVQLAYFDPASGSFIVQAILGVIAAVGVTAKLYWARIRGVLGLTPSSPDEETEENEPGD